VGPARRALLGIRPPSRTTQLADLPPEEDVPSLDELLDFGGETTETFIARTGSPEPRPLAAGDAVPIFRTDLVIEKGSSAGLFEVGEPDTGRHFTLYEFELSIARMFDGRRHASDVIENGVRLGIPVELDGLNKFVRQLWRYGFLAPPGSAPSPSAGEESAWGEREKWDEATRTLFQTGLRLMRQGRPQDAQSYFQAVLDAEPGNAEARELLAAIDRGDSLAARPIGRRAGGRRAEPRRGPGRSIALVIAAVIAVGTGAAAWFLRQRPPPPPAPISAPAPRPPPAWRTAAVMARVHPRLGEVIAKGRGTVLWRVSPGAHVARGARLGALRRAGRRDQPIVAPVEGTLELLVRDRARVKAGAPLATIIQDGVWLIEAFVDGWTPALDAACELRGDSTSERTACRLDGAVARDGGGALRLTVTSEEAPWAGSARSLRVRVAPAGAQPGEGGEVGPTPARR